MRYGFTGQHSKSFKVHASNSGAIFRLTVCSPREATLKGTHWLEGKWWCSREINSAHKLFHHTMHHDDEHQNL